MDAQTADVVIAGGGFMGAATAELIHTGSTSTPIAQYHIGRFAKLAAPDLSTPVTETR